VVILGGLFFVFNRFSGGNENLSEAFEKAENLFGSNSESRSISPNRFLPSTTTGEVIERTYYAFSYSEEHEQAEWIAYELSRENLKLPNVKRTGDFRPDPKVRKASASTRDYTRSGYDRGHLAPAGDMAFSVEAMSESFYMSNISPQIKNFNGGIWRELEENVRNWAMRFDKIYVVTGPVLTRGIRERIGSNEVAVPDEFYKVILDFTEPEIKGIAFIIPNEISNNRAEDYAVSIDRIEEITGIDFFYELFDEQQEEEIENAFDLSLWDFDDKRYELRVNSWNKRK
jgi:endonuclease G